ncbi:MAG: cupin domain-containing protein [Planctomycetota bacterium]|jgi:quercetin dioxygenase-like cupin family protein
MSEEKTKNNVLAACVGQGRNLAQLVEYAQDAVVSKTIVDKPVGTLTIFAFDKDQRLSEHTAPYDAVVQIVDGNAKLTIGGNEVDVTAGQIIVMPANVPHAVDAPERFKMLLTMIRA